MVDGIKGGLIQPPVSSGGIKAGEVPGGKASFSEVLKDSLEKVNSLQNEADRAIVGLAKGDGANIHDAMIAVEKANLSFNMMVQVRNKLLAAYEEIMRTQV